MRAAVRCAAPLPPPAGVASSRAQRRAAPPRAAARHAAATLARRAQRVAPPRRGRCAPVCAATDLDSDAATDADADADARAAMNEVCSRAVRVMLAGDAAAARELRDELQSTAAALAGFGGMADEDELFLTLVAEMLDHKLLPGADALSGDRARAFFAVLAAIEGEWRLAMPGQAEGPPDGDLKFTTYEEVLRKRQQQRFEERFGPLPPPRGAAAQQAPRAAAAAAQDAWELLGVARGASKADIKAAYRKKARQLHPDVSALPDATALFAAVAAAYEQLTSDVPGGGDAEVDSWPEFVRTPKKESPRSAARKSPAAGGDAPDSAGPQVGDLVEYPLPARDRSGDRVAGVALLVSRNCDRGDAKKLPPDLLDVVECEPLRQRERGGSAWVPDDLAPPCFPRMGQLKVLDRSAITYLAAHDAWAFSLPLSPGCSGPAHDEEIML